MTWRRVLHAVVVALLIAGGVELFLRRHELLSALGLLTRPRSPFLAGAVLAQALSLAALAGEEWVFLRPGGVEVRLTDMVELTAAHNAITMTVPGGLAWSTAFLYEQLRRRGADATLAGWDILISGAVSAFCLFLLLAAGVELTSQGPTTGAKIPVAVLAAIPVVVAGVVGALHARGRHYDDLVEWAADRLRRWARARRWTLTTADRLRRYQPSPRQWGAAFGMGLLNWIADLGCLALSIKTLGLTIPWPGVIVAYTLAKIAGVLPITPGGLGVVEAGLTGLLVVYGMPAANAFAVTLLYRLISFWAMLPVGWGYWAYFKWQERHEPAHPPAG